MAQPFDYFTAAELGSNPSGVTSAAVPSMKTYEAHGFVAVVIPFFADTWLPEEYGVACGSNVTYTNSETNRFPGECVRDYKEVYVNTTNGRTPLYYCVRVSHNGKDVRQLCDPTTDTVTHQGAMTGAVRAAVEEMWNDLKRGHFIDSLTRVMTITLQLKSNHMGVRYRITLMFELTSLGAILPSYDVETRILSTIDADSMVLYATISLFTVLFFASLEVIEMIRGGLIEYGQDLWNVMDWVNFFFFFLTYMQIHAVQHSIRYQDCAGYMCTEMGYFDDWRLMNEYRSTKKYISLCVCIQLFKVIKFTSQLIPKMSLMTSVLRTCVADLVFFGIVFLNSVIAFSMMLYVQLGPVMEDYYDQIHSLISLFRALFGDFDIDEIMDNSSGYLNAILFLGYLFVAIFIMLSLFLAILAEAQSKVREKEEEQKEDPTFNEYGACFSLYQGISWVWGKVSPFKKGGEEEKEEEKEEGEEEGGVDAVVSSLRTEVNQIGGTVKELASMISDLRTNPPMDGGYGGGDSSGGDGLGVEEAKAMRKVVEALDAKLSRKLQMIDERLGSRSGKERHKPPGGGGGGNGGGERSHPGPQVGGGMSRSDGYGMAASFTCGAPAPAQPRSRSRSHSRSQPPVEGGYDMSA